MRKEVVCGTPSRAALPLLHLIGATPHGLGVSEASRAKLGLITGTRGELGV